MERTFPNTLDRTVIGVSVTYWLDARRKFLVQYHPTELRPCFAAIDGIRKKISLSFDPAALYRKCIACILAHSLPEAQVTDCPSLDIGIAFRSLRIYASVAATDEGLRTRETRELAEYLRAVVLMAPELADD